MTIDYFCFSVPNLNSTDFNIDENDTENTIWIKKKEKELMDSARNNNMLILFDRTAKKFYLDDEIIDVRNKIIFPRSFITNEEELLSELEKCDALPIVTKTDLEKIQNWPQIIQPVYRKIIVTNYKEFQLHCEDYKKIFKSIFIKTAKMSNIHCTLKYYGFLELDERKIFFTTPALFNISNNDTVFLSETFDSIEDKENDINCKEYRAFILNNELLSISRSYVDYPTEVPNRVETFVKCQINKISSIPEFPNSYVLDVGQILINNDEVVDIIEFNPISSSGLEVCNNLVEELLNQKSTFQLVKKK